MKNSIVLGGLLSCMVILFSGCVDKIYYAGMEKVGFHKRDIMVDRVEDVQKSQQETQEEFKSALEQFGSLIALENSELKSTYEKFNDKYEDSKEAAENLSNHINKLENVSLALFEEWENELELYKNKELKIQSEKKLMNTKKIYTKMMQTMRSSEKKMDPILAMFQDNVLILKHSLNAQAIGALKGEFNSLKLEINKLISQMNKSIKESDSFIKQMNK